MSAGEDFLRTIPLKTRFYDRHEERAYARAIEVASHIVEEPESIGAAIAFIDKHFRADPHRQEAYAIWERLLRQTPEAIARALLEDSADGEELRGSAPVFVVLAGERQLERLR